MKRTLSVFMFVLLLVSMLTTAFYIQPVKANGTIYIRTDGSIDPPTGSIQRDGDLYTLNSNIRSNTDGIVIQRDDMTLDGAGFHVEGASPSAWGFDGINLYERHNVTIQNLTVRAFGYGIGLYNSSCNMIAHMNVTGNIDIGIYVADDSSNNTLIGNRVTDNGNWGIFIIWAQYNTFSANTLERNMYNLVVFGRLLTSFPRPPFELSDYLQSIDQSNLVEGKPIYYIVNRTDLAITAETYPQPGFVGLINCQNITVEGLTLAKNGHGLLLLNTNNSRIENNTMTDNFDGLPLLYSCNNSVTGNVVKENDHGISLSIHSDNNNVYDNLAERNCGKSSGRGHGFHLVEAGGNVLRRNNVTQNQYGFGVTGQHLSEFVNDIDTSNTVDGRLIYYLINKTNEEIPSDAGYMALVNCTNITARNLNLDRSEQGILMAYTANCVLTGNNMTSNYAGIAVCNSSNNWIYHNNFFDDTNHVYDMSVRYPSVHSSINIWDDGYPSGGNYWSDYTGIDLSSGPSQNETGRDGIGDAQYIVDELNIDNYPLMSPWTGQRSVQVPVKGGEDATITSNVTIAKALVTKNTLHFEASGPSGGIGWIDVAFPLINTTDIKVFINGTKLTPPPFPVVTANGTHYFVYFEFTLSTDIITIQFWLLGDITGPDGYPDGKVDVRDVAAVARLFGVNYPDPRYNSDCDINNDLKINVMDVATVARHFGEGS